MNMIQVAAVAISGSQVMQTQFTGTTLYFNEK